VKALLLVCELSGHLEPIASGQKGFDKEQVPMADMIAAEDAPLA
jgi:hypothetical protein